MPVQGLFSNENFYLKLFYFSFLSIFGLVLGAVLAHFMFPAASAIAQMRGAQFVVSVASFALPAFLAAIIFDARVSNFLRLQQLPSMYNSLLAIVLFLVILPFVNLLASWNELVSLPASLAQLEALMRQMEDLAAKITLKMLSEQSVPDLFANLFFLALLPAITEELFFRGALQRILEQKFNLHWCVWISAAIFSAYHMQFFGFVPRLLLGALLGYLMLWGGSIYLPMLAHFINNATLVIFYFLWKNNYVSFNVDNIGSANQSWLGFMSLALAVPLIFILAKRNRTKLIRNKTQYKL